MKKHYSVAKEELVFYGNENTSLQNVLAMLIGPKAEPSVTGELAGLGAKTLSSMTAEDFKKYEGVGELAATRILSAFGLAGILNKFSKEERYVVRSPEDAANYFVDLAHHNQEHFEAIYLNTKNQVVARKNIFKGSLNASLVHPREVFREGLKVSAASLIVAHNHPSGDPSPSSEDIQVTKRLVESGKMIGIELLDHVIIGDCGKFTSLKEKGHC
ncbi:DNA repair protein RadC [Aquibacillus sp. 3ASR75-11]|uniref:DNA repair protein RadC n=1 Tax=Terrihalobacillus insolitus TaxID=2950438 RepID=A0A9X3WTI6_9BACI|nr:DNA repair protein RadC [Terrihalobacillus insolitus]MDC3424368.1 DNA repair protein RadC [Terrihalobacillus insolitus]